jgi:hypothetical protein
MNEAKLNLRLMPELLEAARREAKRRGLTLSDWIRGLMAEASGGPLLSDQARRGLRRGRRGGDRRK